MAKTATKEKPKTVPKAQIKPAPRSTALVPVEKQQAETQDHSPLHWWQDAWNYQVDAWQRSVLFLDTLRQRADNMIEHEKEGMPPLLDFKYEMVLDARAFKTPANYALLKITEIGDICLEDCLDPNKPPVIIVDPRAGHGPGIGGFKKDSEIGIALHEGHPVYFVMFYPDPEPGQRVADVLAALRTFVKDVKTKHKKAPILYGNCQAGWMLIMLAADCQGLAGPVVTNGSPLSYWASSKEGNPMQIMGSLSGGVWGVRFLADLGAGEFDGAWLVQNFENLNPANALWDKYYNLYSNIDKESERFLDFERWWNGFYRLSEAEITETTKNLFIGNKLERGEVILHGDCNIDLKNIKNPLLIFASEGDNITPPRQALHWIRKVYPTTKDLKKAGQRIAYLINPHVGHLGIFVSSKVVRFEHRAILENLDALQSMSPGLYHMIIENSTGDPDCTEDQYKVVFKEKRIEDLCESEESEPFENVNQVSEWNDQLYQWTLRPWVQMLANPITAQAIRELHPMRFSKKVFSSRLNPWMTPVTAVADMVRQQRQEHQADDNIYYDTEKTVNEMISKTLSQSSAWRDEVMQSLFTQLYGGLHPKQEKK